MGLSRTSGVEAHGFSYTSAGGVVDLGSTVAGRSSRANSISADGIVPIGNLTGFNLRAFATDLTDDGSVVVGFAGFGFDRDALIWDAANGIRKLDDVLTARDRRACPDSVPPPSATWPPR